MTLITHEVEVQDFISPLGSAHLGLSGKNGGMEFNCNILRCNRTTHTEDYRFMHPSPPFCRLFLFSRRGGKIVMDGKETEFVPGTIYLLCEGHPFEATYYAGSELLYIHVAVSDHTMSPIFRNRPGLRQVESPALSVLFTEAQSALELQGVIATVLGRFAAEEVKELPEHDRTTLHFRPLFELVRKTPPAQLRVEQLAEAMQMTPSALSKSFRRRTGMALKDYLTRIYERRASELLLYSDASTHEIATRLGHADCHYFYYSFKRISGHTPSAYRQLHRG